MTPTIGLILYCITMLVLIIVLGILVTIDPIRRYVSELDSEIKNMLDKKYYIKERKK